MGRRKTDSSISLVAPVQQTEERIIARDPPSGPAFENSAQGSAVADVDITELLNQVSQLSGQLAVQTQKTETLSNTVLDDTAEIRRLEDALSETRKALRQSESAANEMTDKADAEIEELELEKLELQVSVEGLTADLRIANKQAAKIDDIEKSLKESQDECESLQTSVAEFKKELRAAKKAATAATKAEATIEKLEREKSELQASVKGLTADLKIANKQAAKIDALEKSLKESQDECELLQTSVAESKKELRSAKKATTAATKAEATIEKLEREKSKLHDQCDSLRSNAAESKKELRAAKKVATAADKARTKIEELEREKLDLQDQCDSLQAGTEALQILEESVSEKDARIAELEAELKTYIKADTTSQPELLDEQAESSSARSKLGPSIEQTIDTIAIIEVFRDGVVDQVMNLADIPSRIMIGRGEDCELRLDSKFVSRHHALIFCTDQGVCIEDLNSFNGTVVNSRKVSRCDLFVDDKVTIGDFFLRPRPAVKNDRA